MGHCPELLDDDLVEELLKPDSRASRVTSATRNLAIYSGDSLRWPAKDSTPSITSILVDSGVNRTNVSMSLSQAVACTGATGRVAVSCADDGHPQSMNSFHGYLSFSEVSHIAHSVATG